MTKGQPILNTHNKEEHRPSHTAEHLLNQTMVRMFGCERSKNAHIERKKSKINYNLTECPTPEQIAEIERKMNELIEMDLPVTYEFVTRDNIPEGVKLDKLPEDASETLRLVRIGDYDICPCIGQHVEATKEIGTFKITSTSYNEGSFRIVFKVDAKGFEPTTGVDGRANNAGSQAQTSFYARHSRQSYSYSPDCLKG